MSLKSEFKERLSWRLSQLEDLYFPRALLPSASSPSLRRTLLADLLDRDVPLFLERYGSVLLSSELQGFDALKADYEVNWHLSRISAAISPTEEELKLRSATVKNRRRAYLDRLVCQGDYFSEESMREREPYLHHQYVGRFQDPAGRCMARPGEAWSDTLIRRSEEAMLVQKIREEQQRRGVDPAHWVGNETSQQQEEMEEEEDEDEEEDETTDSHMTNGGLHTATSNDNDAENNDQSAATMESREESLSAEELQVRVDQFTFLMHQKFLSGEDHEHMDYTKIDENETLDDHWMKEANHDAEEKYFDDV